MIQRAKDLNIPYYIFTAAELKNTNIVQDKLKDFDIGFIVLAGFMIKVPDSLISLFPDRIINIHPALLPKYGGRGMYGEHVHKSVIAAKEKESGITIHFVNEKYDEGKIIFQSRCKVEDKCRNPVDHEKAVDRTPARSAGCFQAAASRPRAGQAGCPPPSRSPRPAARG